MTTAPIGIEPAIAMGASGEIAAASWSEGGKIVADIRAPGAAAFVEETVSLATERAAWPSVAVSPNGVVAVAWADEVSEHYEVAIRPPGGTFSAPLDAGPTGGTLDPRTRVATDDAGDVLLGATEEQASGEVAVDAWMPAGGSFTTTALSTPGSEAGAPVVAMNGTGDAIVAWVDKSKGARDIARAATRPAGGTFGATQDLTTDTSEYAFALTAAIGEGGQAAVAWERGLIGPPHRIEASTSAGPADLLSVPQTISAAGGNDETPAISVGGNGEVVAAWEQFGTTDTEALASAFAGSTFGTPTEVSENGSVGEPSIATDAAGDAALTWGSPAKGLETVDAVTRTASGTLTPEVALSAPEEKIGWIFAQNVELTSVGMDGAGDAIVDWEHNADHTIRARILDAAGPSLATSVPATAVAGQTASFAASTADLFSPIASVTWSFGDGGSAEGTALAHTYAQPGTYTVIATATDAVGNATSVSRQIVVAPSLFVCADAAALRACPHIPGTCGPAPACPVPLRCVVPHLKGLGRGAAAHRLQEHGCKLGKVRIIERHHRRRSQLVVVAQSVKATSKLATGAKISITLQPAHRKHHRHHSARQSALGAIPCLNKPPTVGLHVGAIEVGVRLHTQRRDILVVIGAREALVVAYDVAHRNVIATAQPPH